MSNTFIDDLSRYTRTVLRNKCEALIYFLNYEKNTVKMGKINFITKTTTCSLLPIKHTHKVVCCIMYI